MLRFGNYKLLMLVGLAFGIVILGSLGLTTEVYADTKNFTPIKDTTLFYDLSGQTGERYHDELYICCSGQNNPENIRRALLYFNIFDFPKPIHVDKVELKLTWTGSSCMGWSNVDCAPDQTINVHEVTQNWEEALEVTTNTNLGPVGGEFAVSPEATWKNTQFPIAFWSNPGGDFDATISASGIVKTGTWGDAFIITGNGMKEDVQDALDGKNTWNGWLLKNADETGKNTLHHLASKDNTVASNRPQLIVTYSPEQVKPVIKLDGRFNVSVAKGDTYVDRGASVTDNDPDYSGTVTAGGLADVDTDKIGVYLITYTASADDAGNLADPVIRTVNVVEELATWTFVGDVTSVGDLGDYFTIGDEFSMYVNFDPNTPLRYVGDIGSGKAGYYNFESVDIVTPNNGSFIGTHSNDEIYFGTTVTHKPDQNFEAFISIDGFSPEVDGKIGNLDIERFDWQINYFTPLPADHLLKSDLGETQLFLPSWFSMTIDGKHVSGELTNLRLDEDADHIEDSIDADVDTDWSYLFDDGTTSGEIVTDAWDDSLAVNIVKHTDGVLVEANADATIKSCGGINTTEFSAGDKVVITCGSVTLDVISGPIEVEYFGDDGTVVTATLETDTLVTFEEDTLKITNDGTTEVEVTIDDQTITILPGKTADNVVLEIKPGKENKINLKSSGSVPVAIISTDLFDATTIDPQSVIFGPNNAQESHQTGHIKDVNEDGKDDMVLHFPTQDLGISDEDELCISGMTIDGNPFFGCDGIILKN